VFFQSLTYRSPGTSLALVLPFVLVFAGGALPLVVIFIFAGCICTAWLLGEMASELPSSGGMLTFIANGLGPNVAAAEGHDCLCRGQHTQVIERIAVNEDQVNDAPWLRRGRVAETVERQPGMAGPAVQPGRPPRFPTRPEAASAGRI
jgi:amino acid transporter